jgi:hypothetical protein
MAEAGIAPRAPWLLRLCDALSLTPAGLGLGVALGSAAVFLGGELALGRHRLLAELPEGASLRDLRLAFVSLLLLGYAPTAFLAVVRGARRRVEALRPVLDPGDAEAREHVGAAGSYGVAGLRRAGIFGVAVALLLPFLAEGARYAYQPSYWSYEIVWHRVLAPFVGWWIGRFWWAVLAESRRFSRLAEGLPAIDLFDLRPLSCFARQGLANVLLNAGFVSIFALFLFESGFGPIFAVVGVLNVGVSAAAFLLPVHGVHRRIRAAKSVELDWCRERLRRARTGLAERDATDARLADLLAYRAFVEDVREWPFDASTLVRFGLYLMIPLGSWAGGALVERLIDALLE